VDTNKVETWQFRVPGENVALVFGIILSAIIGIIASTLNPYIFALLLVYGLLMIKLHQANYMGNAIKVYEGQFGDLYDTFKEFCFALGISRASLYIRQDPALQAETLGISTCTVILTSSMVEQMNKRELAFVIGHELGHFKAGHTKLLSFINPLGGNNSFASIIFGFWQRKTEYSSDRCGLALTKDVNSAISTMLKLAVGGNLYEKLDIDSYIKQLKMTESRTLKLSEMILASHPYTSNRIKSIMRYWKENFLVNRKDD